MNVLCSETGAARVGGVVNKDGAGFVCDLAAQLVQVNLPALFGQQVVSIKLHTQILADWLAEREAWLGDEDAISDFAHDSDSVVERARTAE